MRTPRGTAQAVEILSHEGSIDLVSGVSTTSLPSPARLLPPQALRSEDQGSFSLSQGPSFRLAALSVMGVAWSQTHSAASIEVREGDVLVSLGTAPRTLHLVLGSTGVLLSECWGELWLAAQDLTVRVAPLAGSLSFPLTSGGSHIVRKGSVLILGPEGDRIESQPEDPRAQALWTRAAPAKVLPPPAPPPSQKKPLPSLELLKESFDALAVQGYQYQVSGAFLRLGTWAPPLLASSIDEITAVRRIGRSALHFKVGNLPWDRVGPVTSGSREKYALELARNLPPPHEELLRAFRSVDHEESQTMECVQERSCVKSHFSLSPSKIQIPMADRIESAVVEERLDRPHKIDWDSLRGTLDLSFTLGPHHQILRAVDRRHVEYLRRGLPGLMTRCTYDLVTEYEFSNRGAAIIRGVPPAILNDLGGD